MQQEFINKKLLHVTPANVRIVCMSRNQPVHRPGGTGYPDRSKIMEYKVTALANGNVKVTKSYFDGKDYVADNIELTEIGAYVYVVNPNGTTTQACEGLRPTGPTLMAGKNLAETVRRTLV